MHRAYKYRIYPTEEQAAQLNQSFAAVRWVYNAALEQRNMYGRAQGTDFFYRDSNFNPIRQRQEIHFRPRANYVGLQNDEELKWMAETSFECLDEALRDLDKALKSFLTVRKRVSRWVNHLLDQRIETIF